METNWSLYCVVDRLLLSAGESEEFSKIPYLITWLGLCSGLYSHYKFTYITQVKVWM